MKKLISIAVILALALALTGCGLFSDNSIVKLDDYYTHSDPKDLSYDQRILLKGDGFGESLESFINSAAYPDTMMYDASGNVIGMYDYDETTGIASGWYDLSTGEYKEFAAGEEVDLGLPDESQMISIPGDVTAYFVVYGNKGSAVAAYMYLILSDASAKDTVISAAETAYGFTLTTVNDTVLTTVQDADYIAAQFAAMEDYGYSFNTKDADAYANILNMNYGVRTYGGVNPYTPYADHTDPEGLDFDTRVVMTGSGEAAVEEKYTADISSMTDFIYAKDGNVVAQYTYYECPSKEAADELMDGGQFMGPTRVSGTVIVSIHEGANMDELLNAYIGYNVLKDKSLTDYVRMLEETYFTVVCD